MSTNDRPSTGDRPETGDRPSTTDRGPGTPTDRSGERPELVARETTNGDGATECTIYPTEVPEDRRTTTWITAEAGSYVDLDECR